MKRMLMPLIVVLAACLVGCNGRGNVLVTGRLNEYSGSDSVFVTLTDNFEYVKVDPQRFDIKPSGRFELEFTVGRVPPPVTFVKNGSIYAKLKIHSLWDPSPAIVDEVRGRVFDLEIKENGLFVARVEL